MRRQTLIALAVAAVLGLLAVYFANAYLGRPTSASRTRSGMTKVAVAAVPLDYGVDITPDKIRFADYPTGSVPSGSFRSSQLAAGGQAPRRAAADAGQRADSREQGYGRRPGRLDRRAVAGRQARRRGPHQRRVRGRRFRSAERRGRRADHAPLLETTPRR